MKAVLCCSLLASLFMMACKKDDPSPLDGCCGNPAIDEPVGNGHIYVPNIFTPNQDGINDDLAVYADTHIILIRDLTIMNADDEIVFFIASISPPFWNVRWDGRVNGEEAAGIYTITFEAEALDGTKQVLEGQVCNYPCDGPSSDKINHSNCRFPSQNDGGLLNENFPSNEYDSDCFEF